MREDTIGTQAKRLANYAGINCGCLQRRLVHTAKPLSGCMRWANTHTLTHTLAHAGRHTHTHTQRERSANDVWKESRLASMENDAGAQWVAKWASWEAAAWQRAVSRGVGGGGVSQCVICNVDARVDCALQSGCCLLRVVAVVFAAAAADWMSAPH